MQSINHLLISSVKERVAIKQSNNPSRQNDAQTGWWQYIRIHWKLIRFPLAVLGSTANRGQVRGRREEPGHIVPGYFRWIAPHFALYSPRTDNTLCLMTLSSTRSHAHESLRVQSPLHCYLFALCHTATRVGHSRVLYRCRKKLCA